MEIENHCCAPPQPLVMVTKQINPLVMVVLFLLTPGRILELAAVGIRFCPVRFALNGAWPPSSSG